MLFSMFREITSKIFALRPYPFTTFIGGFPQFSVRQTSPGVGEKNSFFLFSSDCRYAQPYPLAGPHQAQPRCPAEDSFSLAAGARNESV